MAVGWAGPGWGWRYAVLIGGISLAAACGGGGGSGSPSIPAGAAGVPTDSVASPAGGVQEGGVPPSATGGPTTSATVPAAATTAPAMPVVKADGLSGVLRLSWSGSDGASLYRIQKRLDPTGIWVTEGSDLASDARSGEIAVPLSQWSRARVRVQACNALGCGSSLESVALAPMVAATGYLKASNTRAADRFGADVALSSDGNTLAVGATGEPSNATGVGGNGADGSAAGAGAVYVFARVAGSWSQQAYLKASNTAAGARFGGRVSLSADGAILAVGADQESGSGAVYLFVRSGSTWSQQALLKASNAGANDRFGASVALAGDGAALAVGAPGESSSATGIGGNQNDESVPFSGAAYLFVRSAGVWSQAAYIKASNPGTGDGFGTELALSADGATLAVGAHQESSAATGVGGNEADNSRNGAGAVYVFARGNGTWAQQAYVKAANTGIGDAFGSSLALSADGATLAVGAQGECSRATGVGGDAADDSACYAGAAYVFRRTTAIWSQEAYVKASNTGASDRFGISVALSSDGTTMVVGAVGEASRATGIDGDAADDTMSLAGAAYVFDRSAGAWSQRVYVKAPNTGGGDRFGGRVALSGDAGILAVGAEREASRAYGVGGNASDDSAAEAGAAYLY